MSKITFKSLLIIVLAVLPLTFFGQENTNDNQKKENTNYWFVGFDEGATLLFGDNKAWDFDNVRPQIGIHGGYNFAKHFQVYGRISAGTLKGELENVFKVENSSFIAYDLNVSADVISLIKGYNPDRVLGLKPHVGFGQMMYQARTLAGGKIYKYGYDDATTTDKGNGIGGRKVVMEVPFGVEFEFNLTRRCALYLDVMATYTDTDCLDGYASGDHYDWYTSTNVGFRYKFRKPKPVPCEAVPCDPVPCELDQDALNEAVKEAVKEALKDYQPAPAPVQEAEEEEADNTESMEAIQKNYEEKDIHLAFKVGKAEVEDSPANNAEVEKIKEDGREIHTILTVGYASPEGNDDQNQKLSEERAQAAADFIEKKLGEEGEGINFQPKGMGSDWDGLKEAVNNSNISNKAEIMKAIDAKDANALNALKAKNPELGDMLNNLRRTQIFINK